MDLPPGTGVTNDNRVNQAGMLRRAWFDVAGTVAPQLGDLPFLLEDRLSALEAAGRLDEPSLLAVAEDASQHAMEHGAGDVARTLSKRLRRSIYEFLLALDAVNPAELANAPAVDAPRSPFSPVPAADRPPVSIVPADVSGADDAPTAGTAPVPLWEQVSRPEQAREMYRVASRDVIPAEPEAVEDTEDDEAASFDDGPVADLLAADAAEIAELAAQFAEPETQATGFAWVTPEDTADGSNGGAPELETAAEWTADAEVAAGLEREVAEPEGTVLDVAESGAAAASAEPEAAAAEATDPEASAAEFTEPQAAAAETAEPEASASNLTEPEAGAREFAEPHAAAAETAEPEATPAEFTEPEAAAPEFAQPEAAAPETTEAEASASELTEPDAAAPELVEPEAAARAFDEPEAAAPEAIEPEASAAELTEPAAAAPELAEPEAAAPEFSHPEAAAVADHTAVEPTHTVPNGVRPHRDLLRVPRQFRRLPPLAGHREPHQAPAAEVAQPPAAPMPAPPAAPVEEEESLGVPSLPWPLEAATPQPEAPAPAAEPEPEEELGVPFAPLAGSQAAFTQVEAEAEPAPAAPPVPDPFAAAPQTPLPAPTAPVPASPWLPTPTAPAAAAPFPIAPMEGFHLTDPGALDMALANAPDDAPPAPPENPFTAAVPPVNVPPQVSTTPPRASTPAQAPGPAPAADQQAHDDDGGTWRVRQSPRAQLLAERMAQKRREEAARAAFEAASVHDEHSSRKRRRGEEPITDVASARRQLDEHLRRKRGAEAAALLQRLAQELGGRDIADLALDAGDRCRALGQSRSATNCYLAAWRADPVYETPLWRLSDVCLNDQEIELAVGYLERIADLMRSRGDDEGAIGVYRKIAMIAPERQDVRDVIRLAKTTGRLDV